MKKDQAIRPDYFQPLKIIREMDEEKEVHEDSLREERLLHALSSHEGWKIMEKFMEAEKLKLDSLNKAQIEKGASFDEIGRNAVLIQLCKEELNTILNKVKDAREAVESEPAK